MKKIIISIIVVLITIYIVPFLVYSLFTAVADLKVPGEVSPFQFLISVLVSKVGVAITFVLIFYYARNAFNTHWFRYALLWWLMFSIGEIGQAIGPAYSWNEAIAGIISETIYLPLSAYLVNKLLPME